MRLHAQGVSVGPINEAAAGSFVYTEKLGALLVVAREDGKRSVFDPAKGETLGTAPSDEAAIIRMWSIELPDDKGEPEALLTVCAR